MESAVVLIENKPVTTDNNEPTGAWSTTVFVPTWAATEEEVAGAPSIAGSWLSSARSTEPWLERLGQLAELKANWDSYGARPISRRAITQASRVLKEAPKPCDNIAPLADGGVQIEWRSSHADLELEIGPRGGLSYLACWKTDGEEHCEEVERARLTDALAIIRRIFE